jgi:hypothetical protein
MVDEETPNQYDLSLEIQVYYSCNCELFVVGTSAKLYCCWLVLLLDYHFSAWILVLCLYLIHGKSQSRRRHPGSRKDPN